MRRIGCVIEARSEEATLTTRVNNEFCLTWVTLDVLDDLLTRERVRRQSRGEIEDSHWKAFLKSDPTNSRRSLNCLRISARRQRG